MSELRQLREALRTREGVAPDPDAVLASAHGRIRRRRTRRRAAGAAAAVALVIAGVGTAVSLLRPSDEPESVQSADGATDLPVTAPALPFSVAYLPSGFALTGWTITGGYAGGVYDGPNGKRMEIRLSDGELPARTTTSQKTPQATDDAQVSYPDTGGIQLQKQVAPGRVLTILTGSQQFPPALMIAVADSVRLVPTPVSSTLRALRAPAGLTVRQWTGSGGFDHLMLCPPEVPAESPPRQDGRCYSVTVEDMKPGKTTTTRAAVPPRPDEPGISVRRVLPDGQVLVVETGRGTEPVADAIAEFAVGA